MRFLTALFLSLTTIVGAEELIEQEFALYHPNYFNRDPQGNPLPKFKEVTRTDADDYPQHMTTTIEKNPCIHSTCHVNYWIFNLGTIIAIYDADLPSFTTGKQFDIGFEFATEQENSAWILHAQKANKRLRYRAFYITNEKPNEKKQEETLEQLKEKVGFHLESVQGTLENFYVFKIELVKDGSLRGATGRTVLKLMDLSASIQPAQGDHKLITVEEWADDRKLEPNYFDRIDVNAHSKVATEVRRIKTKEDHTINALLTMAVNDRSTEPRIATFAMSRALGVIANKYARFMQEGSLVPIDFDKMKENWSHGFTHGIFEQLFRNRHRLNVLSELRGGAGYIDLFLLLDRGAMTRPIPIIIEFKQPQSGDKKLDNVGNAYNQIGTTRYDLILPAIRGSPKSVILLGVAFNQDGAKRIRGTIKPSAPLDNAKLIEAMKKVGRNKPRTQHQKDPLDEIKAVAEWMYFSNPSAKSIPHVIRKILGRIAAEIRAGGAGQSMEVHYFATKWPELVVAKDRNKGRSEITREAITILMGDANGSGPLYCLCISEFRGVDPGGRSKTAYIDAADTLVELNKELQKLRLTGHIFDSDDAAKKVDKIGKIHFSIAGRSADKMKLPNIEIGGERLKALLERNGRHVTRVDIELKRDATSFTNFLQVVHRKSVHVQLGTDVDWIDEPEKIGTVGAINQGLDVKSLIGRMTRQPTQGGGPNVEVAGELAPLLTDLKLLINSETDFHAILSGALETDNDHVVLNEQSSGTGRIDILLVNKKSHQATLVELKHKPGRNRQVELALAYDQAESYARYLNHMTEEATAKCLAIVYYGPNEVDTREDTGPVLPFCHPVTGHFRGKRSTTCPSFGGIGRYGSATLGRLLRNEKIPLQERLEMSNLRKQLTYPDSASDIAASPCADKLPWKCIDEYSLPLTDGESQSELVPKLNNGKMKRLYSKLAKVSDYAGRVWYAYSTVDLVDQCIRGNDYTPLAKHIAHSAISHAMPYLGQGAVLAIEYREILGAVALSLQEAGLPPFLAHRIARVATVHISARMQKFVYRAPMGVLSLVNAVLDTYDLIKMVRSSEWAQMQNIDKVIYISVPSCNVAAGYAYTVVAVSGQWEAEPVIAIVHFTCLTTAHVASNIRTTTNIDEYVVLSWREKYLNFLPLLNNMKTLKTDQIVHYGHEHSVNRSSLPYFSLVALSLYDVTVNTSSSQIINMTLPQNVHVRIVNSPLDESHNTPSMSRTLMRLNSNGRRLACAPTAPDAEEECSKSNSCTDKTKTYTIRNRNAGMITDEHNYCDHAMMVVNVTFAKDIDESNRAHPILFDLPALNSSVIEAGSMNHACYFKLYANTVIRESCSLKNHVVHVDDPNPANVVLNPHAENTLDLNGHNFSVAQAESSAGSLYDRIIGNDGSRIITAGKRTSFVVSGGAESITVDMSLSEHPHVHIDLYQNNYLDLSYYKHNAVSVNLIERGEGAVATNETTAEGTSIPDGPSKIDSPMREDFNLETDMALTIISPRNTGLLELIQGYTYCYNSHEKKFHIYKRETPFSEIYSVGRVERMSVGTKTPNASQRVKLFFSDYADGEELRPEFEDRDIRLPDETVDFKQLLTVLTTDETAAKLHATRVRLYNSESNEALLIDYRLFGTRFFTTSSQHRSSLIKFKEGVSNFVFIEGCGDVEIVIDERFNFNVHIETDSRMAPKSVDVTNGLPNDTLLITYECGSMGNRSTIRLYPFVARPNVRREVTVRTNRKDTFIVLNPRDDGEPMFTSKIELNRDKPKYGVIRFDDDARLINSFTANVDLYGVKELFFPDVYMPKDLKAVRSGDALLLFEKHTMRSFSFPSYFAASTRRRIHMNFVHGYATLSSFAEKAQDLSEYAGEKRDELLTHLVEDGHLDWHTVEDDLEVHAANLAKLLVLSVECEPEGGHVTILAENSTANASDSALSVLVCGHRITIFDLDTANYRPLIATPSTILDLPTATVEAPEDEHVGGAMREDISTTSEV